MLPTERSSPARMQIGREAQYIQCTSPTTHAVRTINFCGITRRVHVVTVIQRGALQTVRIVPTASQGFNSECDESKQLKARMMVAKGQHSGLSEY